MTKIQVVPKEPGQKAEEIPSGPDPDAPAIGKWYWVKDEEPMKDVGMNHYLHLIKEVRRDDRGRLNFLIGNNRGGLNGGCPGHHVYGVFVRAE